MLRIFMLPGTTAMNISVLPDLNFQKVFFCTKPNKIKKKKKNPHPFLDEHFWMSVSGIYQAKNNSLIS